MALSLFSPSTIDEAAAIMAGQPQARCIAGGASLVALLNASAITVPPALVSLDGVAELVGIVRQDDGGIRIGAMTRHAAVAASALFEGGQRVLPAAAAVIANHVVRNMGTLGGSVAFADPAADYPPALVAADASVECASSSGRRVVPTAAFFTGGYATALQPGEIVVAVTVPPPPAGSVGRYRKLSRTHGDFAMASVALVLAMRDGVATHVACAVGGCGPVPVRLPDLEAGLVGTALDEAVVREAGAALAAACAPTDDVRATAAYRRAVVPRLFASIVAEARSLLDGAA